MPTDTVATFRENAERHHVTVHRTPPDGITDAIADLLDPPAIGVRLEAADLPPGVETDPTPADLDAANTGVTAASLGVASYGSLVLESDAAGTEWTSLFPERHVAVLRASDVVPGMTDALEYLGPHLRDGGSAVFATGPSATADMGELVLGAHGPEEVHVVLVQDADRRDVYAEVTDGDGDPGDATGGGPA